MSSCSVFRRFTKSLSLSYSDSLFEPPSHPSKSTKQKWYVYTQRFQDCNKDSLS